MATLDYCPSCGQVTPVEPTSKTEEIVVRGDNIEVLVEGQRCTICGENFSDANEMDRTLTRAYEAYRKRHSLPAPSDIRELRERYGASQKAFGLILGFGELTINSYEQGALPADANVNLLRLVENPLDFKRLFAARKELIGPTQRKRIESAIAKFDEMVPVSAFAKERSPAYSASSSNESSIYTGYMEPDKDRLFALIRAVLKAVGRPLYKTQILKLLFYCDFSHFRKSTVSISGWPYAAIDFGPVPDDFQLLLPEATSLGLVVCSPDESQER
ncbi:MAG: type II TA system antitoxin MqsA family protein, partial [Spirochaetota bacterium]